MLAYASCVLNSDDDVSLLRIINTPARGMGPSVVEAAVEYSTKAKCSVWKALQDPGFQAGLTTRSRTSVQKFVELIDSYETKLNEPLSNQPAILRELVEEVEYLDDLKRTCKTPEEALSRETNVRDMLTSFDDYGARSSEGLRGFLDEMMLRQEREEENEDEDVDLSKYAVMSMGLACCAQDSCIYACTCLYTCMHVCMYACIYVCITLTHIYIHCMYD